MIALVTGTNDAEAGEFFHTYITPLTIIYFSIAVVIVFVVFFWLSQKSFPLTRKAVKGILFYFLLSFCGVGYSFYTLPGRLEGILRTKQKNLVEYLQHPQMAATSEHHPDVVMIIIGESFVKSHSSLYGYDKVTNPRLQQLEDSGELIVFREPIAPATHTAQAFKHFMTTYSHGMMDKEWFECLTLPEIFVASGYHTAWFSNQAKTGWYDNISGAFAALCDTIHYTTTHEDGEQDAKPDGLLLGYVPSYVKSSHATPQAIFVHLMGQHVDFEKRYPDAFDYFKESQYADKPKHQREDYATYDNATRYNDYVVDSLFATLKDKNAVGIYFSDHGMDFYESGEDYCSHAKDNDPVSYQAGLKTPFMVYTTASYRAANPDVMIQLKDLASKSYQIEQFPTLVLQIIGYKVNEHP
jgi:heptose-I-phosphate ethanolaminephosphotransferase